MKPMKAVMAIFREGSKAIGVISVVSTVSMVV